MNVALLDQLNRDGALTDIARCGGLIALAQLQQFLDCHKSSAHRAYTALERARMCAIVRPAGFMILTRAVAAALGPDLPTPPQRGQLRATTARHCIGRAAYFLRTGWAPAPMGDLTGRWKSGRTRRRVAILVKRQILDWRDEAKRLHASYQQARSETIRRQYDVLRRKLREPSTILNAGMSTLRHFRGLHIVPDAPPVRFVFFDRATPAARLKAITLSLRRFAAATAIDARLDLVCGSARALRRVTCLLAQTDARLAVELLDLDYERLINSNAERQPPLITHQIQPLLDEIGEQQ